MMHGPNRSMGNKGLTTMKTALSALLSLALMGLMTATASAQLCVLGVLGMAIYANATEHRELTAKEAATCGLLYGRDKPEAKAKPAKKKTARKAEPKTKPN